MQIVDATPSVVNVEDYEGAARGIAITTLRAVVGSMLLDDVLAKREQINAALRGKLDEVTNRWGIKVAAVEIREILPPGEIQEAMTRQMSAERTRRAMVLEADGRRDAAIRVAEGQKQATILEAEGARQSTILRAEGLAVGLETVSRVARGVDSQTMALQYLDTLRALGTGPASKFVLPLELVNIVRPFVEHTARAGDEGRGAGERPPGNLDERH
jgi:regulator of protease activity HflC (stomatin/prohibitin superfamily)